ncbi:hypothetical protein Ga0100231_007985 [Opitutaceae bacterium TAV4]|uniref:hypothetical protein n=1 Tax=Geminisphaera colitermitum TaxID=1148786 RepID=UPI0005BCF53C|nr:hypothetical protein [Geminisphaera colitermitum]RRJ94308.1 hypothetical protein Ga0100231_007985 [Opitutaceae bacterium TAV4]RRJ98398.1 hypothetical protein Ga0100230_008255 [Opitutaceae bacterium TAV3]
MSASLLSSHRLHWGFHRTFSGNLQLHLDLLVRETPEDDIPILMEPEPDHGTGFMSFSPPGFSAPPQLPEELGY